MDDMNELERQLADVVRGAMRPQRPVDAAAIVRSARSARPAGHWSATTTRLRRSVAPPSSKGGFSMPSAARFIVATVILALFGGFLLTAVLDTGTREDVAPAAEGASLTPSGLEILSPSSGAIKALATDGQDSLWALEHPGRLVRFDLATDTATAWTLADDIAFGLANTITASAQGGVWLVGGDTVRLFDGERFARVVEAPTPLALGVEAGDGSLWVTSESGSTLHWDGSAWKDYGPEGWTLALAVDSAGRPWIGGRNRVMVLDGSEWTRFDSSDAPPLGGLTQSIMETPDGSIWVAVEGGLARFDGANWTVESPVPGSLYQSLAASPDGTVWASSTRNDARVWRSDGTDWVKFANAAGLPDPDWSAKLAIVGDRLFLGTDAGTYERTGDSWELAWDVAPARSGSPRLLATGGDEIWAVDTRGVRQIQDGTWTEELDWKTQLPDSGFDRWLRDLALGPDGTVWVAGPDGIAYRDGERWEFIDDRRAGAIAVGPGGTVWAGRSVQAGGCRLWKLQEEGGTWVREDIDGCPLRHPMDLSLAVDADGTVWLGGTGGWVPGGLARYASGEWEVIEEIDDTEVYGGVVLGTDGDGAVWVVSQRNLGTENSIAVGRGSMARFDKGDVSIVAFPKASGFDAQILAGGGMPWTALDAEGMPWTSTERGLARFDGHRWQYPYEDTAVPWMKVGGLSMRVGAVAADGTVYGITLGITEGDIMRFPA